MKILFVSRAFPPTIGGIEKQNAELAQFLGNKASLTLIANTWGKSFLPAFLPYALIKMLFLAKQHDVVLLGDGVLAPWGAIVKILFPRTPVASIIHGLDIAFARQSGFLARAYRLLNIPSLQKLDGVICVSQDTKTLAESFGIDPTRTSVIPNGVDPASFSKTHSRDELKELIGRDRASKKVILRLGRFVRHKGVEWFIRNVMPQLPDHVILVAAGGVAHAAHPGDSNTFPSCEAAIQELGLEKRVVLLPNLHRDKVNILLSTADLAVAPNIPVQGTGDGFGIAVIEAGINRLPIVVSKLGGLQEAVADGHNGLFAEPGNATDFVEKITWLLTDDARRKTFGEKARDYTLAHYSWNQLAERYREVLSGLVSKNK